MSRFQERMPREMFDDAIRPMVRFFGSRDLILRINEAAKTAIPRQTKLQQLMPKLEILLYEQNRPRVEEEVERLWSLYFESRLEEAEEQFEKLSDRLNENLDGENLPLQEEKLIQVKKTVMEIAQLLSDNGFSEQEIESVFRLKAYTSVMHLYIELKKTSAFDELPKNTE